MKFTLKIGSFFWGGGLYWVIKMKINKEFKKEKKREKKIFI